VSQPVTDVTYSPATRPSGGVLVIACAVALAFGFLLPIAPRLAIGAIVLVPLAVATPVAALAVLLAVTILVPFDVQDSLSVVGGREQPGLLAIDVLLFLGLARVGWLAVRGRLAIDRRLVIGGLVALIVTAALVWGLALGSPLSGAGHEARRVVLGVGTFLLALPLVDDRSARRRLMTALVVIGMLLALWGLAQWVFSVGYTESGDVGIRPGMEAGSTGHGQLQGGMYAFPLAVILAWAALLSGQVRGVAARWVVAAVLVLNAACLLLTFERTLWVATAVVCAILAVTYGAATRRLALKWAVVLAVAIVTVVALAPNTAQSTMDRLTSIPRFVTDTSFTSRVVESHAVLAAIGDRPITGSGLGATLTWGLRDTFATITTPFSHDGYLWLAWKLGVPAAAFIVGVMVIAVLRRTSDEPDAAWHAVRRGSQAAVLALLLVCITFPVFNALGITAAMGFVVAVCFSRRSA
jgi:O-antigen ligase